MMSLFSSFDMFFFNFQYYFLVIFICLFFCSVNFINFNKNALLLFNFYIGSFMESLKPKMFSKASSYMFSCFMLFIFFLNLISIFPYNFSFTSQLSVILTFSFTSWISFSIFNLLHNMKGFLSHCIPEGTPMMLTWFLFAIELVSNFIRPITLSVRLLANILAGHLLMILLSKVVLKFMLVVPVYVLLNMVELFVGLIQSYIFLTMVSLYYSDL